MQNINEQEIEQQSNAINTEAPKRGRKSKTDGQKKTKAGRKPKKVEDNALVSEPSLGDVLRQDSQSMRHP